MGTSANYALLDGSGSGETVVISIPWTFQSSSELFIWTMRTSDGAILFQDIAGFGIDVADDFTSVEIDNPYWDPQTLTGEAITCYVGRVSPRTQTYSLGAGPLNPTALVAQFDKVTRLVQEIAERTPTRDQYPVTSGDAFTIPRTTERLSKIMAFDADGDLDLLTVSEITTAAQALLADYVASCTEILEYCNDVLADCDDVLADCEGQLTACEAVLAEQRLNRATIVTITDPEYDSTTSDEGKTIILDCDSGSAQQNMQLPYIASVGMRIEVYRTGDLEAYVNGAAHVPEVAGCFINGVEDGTAQFYAKWHAVVCLCTAAGDATHGSSWIITGGLVH